MCVLSRLPPRPPTVCTHGNSCVVVGLVVCGGSKANALPNQILLCYTVLSGESATKILLIVSNHTPVTTEVTDLK